MKHLQEVIVPALALFERWARETPDALAVEAESGRLTYAELDRRAGRLARRLRSMGVGVGPETIVALRLERSPELVLATLAVLKAGGAWLPIDPAHPAERLAYILRDSKATLLVTEELLAGLDGDREDQDLPLLPDLGPDQLAYVIYTSGSTGMPKGTGLTHGNLASFTAWDRGYFGRNVADRCTLLAGPGFDASVWEIWSALTAGASLHVPPAGVVVSPPALLEWMAERGITVSFLPTPLAEAVLGEPLPTGLALRALLTGGDRLRRRPAPGLPFELFNLYGPTECTVVATGSRVMPEGEGAGLPDIGQPIANTRIELLDGEICITGPGLGRGYLGRPELTAESFVPDAQGEPGGRLYRTGDLGRWGAGGGLEFLGRVDHQVKIRGFRIELGEIEAVLCRHAAVRQASVLVREGETRLTAYLTLREAAAREELRAFLAGQLPEYMVPTAWTFLDALPLTPNGKVDRRALEKIEPDLEAGAEAPRTPLEERVAGFFAEVLGRPAGIHDDFLELGGHSLLAARLTARVREAFGVDLGMRGVFEHPTVAGLAAWIEEAARHQPSSSSLLPVPRGGGLPLSFAQRRLWFLESLQPGTALYNLQHAYDLRGGLSVPVLAAALSGVVERHEALRTVFVEEAGEPLQTAREMPFSLPVADLSGLPEAARRAEAGRLTGEEARRPYDLEAGPLLRTALLKMGEGEHRLLLGMHHIVSDGWSMSVLPAEVSALYRGAALEPLAVQYPDFAVWQRRRLTEAFLAEPLAWWRQRLAGAPAALELPTDRPRPAVASFRGAVERLQLTPHGGSRLEAGLSELGRGRGATLFMVLLAGFQALLHRYTGQEDLVVGSPVAGRDQRELEGMIGFFVNMVPLRGGLAGDPEFTALLEAARETALGAYTHQELPFERLVEELAPGRDFSRAPVFQVVLALQDAPLGLDLGIESRALQVPTGTAKFDLTLFVERGPGGLAAIAEYATDLFEAPTVRRLLRNFQILLEGIAENPYRPVSDLPLLSAEEREQVLAGWNRTAAEIPALPVHRQFEEWAREAPEALAIESADQRLTYGDLNRRANRLAHRLRGLGMGPETVVVLRLERSPELVTAALAVLKAGGAYLPIDPSHPMERLAYTVRDCGAPVLLTVSRLVPGSAGIPVSEAGRDAGGPRGATLVQAEILALDTLDLSGESEEDPGPVGCGLDSLAYLIYTSGSTGTPKGIELRHRGLASLVEWDRRTLGRTAADRCSLTAGPGFDVSIWEVWSALATGASLHVPPADVVLSPPGLLAWMAEKALTVVFLSTPLAEAVLAEPISQIPGGLALRALTTGGDRLSRRPSPDLPFGLWNVYGPAESTVATSVGRISPVGDRPPEIGTPIANTRVYILDRHLRPVPAGSPGELCVAGEGLARGYRRQPGMTAERFVPDPYGEPGTRMYRTGDLARWLPDGGIEFLGRIDFQVKIRGVRIELGEIEAALRDLPGVETAVVLPREDRPGDRRLVAYVAGTVAGIAGEGLSGEALRAALARRLPEPMIPSAWVFLEEMPLTPNGKADRRALERIVPPEPTAESQAALSPAEEIVAGLFAEVLGTRQPLGPDDDFFQLGGHSLLAVQLVSRFRSVLGVDLDVRTVFARPTVAALAEAVVQDGAGRPAAAPIVPEDRGTEAPLSFAQQRLWFLDRYEGATALYNVPVVFHIRGAGLSVPALAAALGEVVRRHEALRSVFRDGPDGEPVQVVQPFVAFDLPLLDVTPDAARDFEQEMAEQPFDLAHGPLLRALLLRTGPEEHRLVVSTHHIASDGWSVEVLAREISQAYQGQGDCGLPPLPVQYADYAVWQRRWLTGEVLDAELAHWRERLAGAPAALELPADRPRPAVQSFRGAVRHAELDPEVAAGLSALGRRRGATFFMTALAAFCALLHRWTGQEDLVVGTPVAGRGHREIEGLIGFFVNTLALRTSLAGDPGFGELLGRVRTAALEAYAHQDLPFEKLVAELAPERDLSRTPIFQVVMWAQERPVQGLDLGPGLTAPMSEIRTATSKFDLSLEISGLTMGFEYSTDLFDEATIERYLKHLGTLLAGIVAAPDARVSDLPLMPEEERLQIARWDVEAARSYPEGDVLHGLFEAQAARTPDAVALVRGGEVLTYAELEARSARLARRLRRLGVGPEIPVGVCLPRESGLIVALMAVLRAGGFYVPLDPAYPSERLSYLLEDSGCGLVVTHESVEHVLPPSSSRTPRLLRIDDPGEDLPAEPAGVLPGNLSYLIYTSGSTGRPKAVAIEHRSAVLLAYWARDVFSPEEFAGMLGSTSITFDMSVFEIFATLAWGGTLILVDNALALASLKDLPEGIEVRLLDTVPSAAAELLRTGGVPPSVRTINLGGEAVPRSLADLAYGRPETERLFNLYGPSEDTTFSTIALIGREPGRVVTIGRPLDGTRGWVLDRRLELVPVGVPGELYLAGGGLSRGYLGRPELTAERYIPDPFGEPGSRMYKTGDLVRRRADGELEYLGRLDHQVKIRGFRVELGEIEAVLTACPGVEDAVVMAREDEQGDKRLVAYVAAPADTAEAGMLREAVQARLPVHMTPSAFVLLEALPRMPNGKVDRHALARMEIHGETAPVGREPETPVELALAQIFADLLGLESVGADDDFFLLGGHSLLVARLVARVRDVFEVELPLRVVFETPTVAGLAAWIEENQVPVEAEAAPAQPQTGHPPVSFAQQRLWLLDRLRSGTATYNMPSVYRVHGPLRPEVLEEALNEIVRRHEALRTVFGMEEGQPVQIVQPFHPQGLPLLEIPREEEARFIEEWSRRPFDLERGPLFRAVLLRLSETEHALLLNFHHIVSDGWSNEILAEELGVLYQAFAAGLPSPLAPLPMQYAEYAVWERGRLAGEVLDRHLAFWRSRLGQDPEPLELPADHPRPAVQSGRGAVERLALPARFGTRLQRYAQARGATPFMAFLAAFQTLLHRYTGRTGLSVGTPVANRNQLGAEGLIGCFVNTLVLHTDLGGDPTFSELLERVRETALSAYTHQELPFERLVEELVASRDLSRPPLCQVLFALQQDAATAAGVPVLGPGLEVEVDESHPGTAKFDLTLFVDRRADRTELLAEYGTDLFEASTVRRLLGHLAVLIRGIERNPQARISELPLLSEAERWQVLGEWNRTEAEIPDEPVHLLFRRWAERTPDAVAVQWSGGRLTYGELAERAGSLARWLRRKGVGPETVVALRMERSPRLVTAALAVLAAGGAYLPVDPSQPEERLSWMLQDSGAALVLEAGQEESQEPSRFQWVDAGQDGLAYVIYTSGSTGQPKGTELPHRGLSSLIAWHRRTYGLGPGDRSTLLAGPGFDASVWETWAPLTAGAALHIPPPQMVLSPPALVRWMAEEGITVSFLPTPLAEAVLAEPAPEGLVLRWLLTGGDRLVRRPAPDATYGLVNHYGPTESTVVATAGSVAPYGDGAPGIGSPIANVRAYVLDRSLRPVPLGASGELCLAGETLARGYLGRPELTAERFVPDPLGTPGTRMYRTGDLVRHRPDGTLEFQGRIDHQVKIRGFRIELGEVEAALGRMPGVAAAAVLAREDAGGKKLVAYVVGDGLASADLRQSLRDRLPEYMVPSVFVFLESLPLTPNGKVDRRALPPPAADTERSGDDPAFLAPRTPLEEQVAEAWKAVLGIDRVGVHDNFWDLGGHSLLATRVLARLNEELGLDLPLQTLFTAPTLSELARAVGEAVLASWGEMADAELAELEGLGEEEIQALLAAADTPKP